MTIPANPLRSGGGGAPEYTTATVSTNGNNPTELVNLGDAGSGKSYLILVKVNETTFLAQQAFSSWLILAHGFSNFEASRSIGATIIATTPATVGTAVAELSGNDVVVTVTGIPAIDLKWTAQVIEVD